MASAECALPGVPNFKVLKALGRGSYGKVYKVQRVSDDKFYALKEMDLSDMHQSQRMDAVNEVRLLVSISHPSIIRYHEAFLHGSKLCVVMEYAPYGDLKYYINKGRRLNAAFPEEAIWRIFLQLCKGLSALHATNIIHRDIKPANIFLCQNDVLKIGDLGVAKALTRMNFARTCIGTPAYMAPEVWSGKPYSYSSDLWSTGCVLYEMMTFRVAFEGHSHQELQVKICGGRYRPVPAGSYSTELIDFCHALLNLDPRRRPTPEAILSSATAARWLWVLPKAPVVSDSGRGQGTGSKHMMDTIIVPRDIRQLNNKLPPPSYDSTRNSDQAPSRDQQPRRPSPAPGVRSSRDQAPRGPSPAVRVQPAREQPVSAMARLQLSRIQLSAGPGSAPLVQGSHVRLARAPSPAVRVQPSRDQASRVQHVPRPPSVPQPRVASYNGGYYAQAGSAMGIVPGLALPTQQSRLQKQASAEQLMPGIRPAPRRVTYS